MSKELKCRFRLKWEADSRDTGPSKNRVRKARAKRKFQDSPLVGKWKRLTEAAFRRLMIGFLVLRTQTKQGAS